MIKFLAGAFLLLFSFTAAAQTPEDSVAFAGARWQITPLAAGAECGGSVEIYATADEARLGGRLPRP